MPAVYVITYYKFNHGEMRPGNPLDSRFLDSSCNHQFYLIDRSVPSVLRNKNVILEHELDPVLHKAGGKHFGEWSFLLAEERHAFCQYPFFMISSRFYEKNRWLKADLNQEWNRLFSYFDEYGWGYLPSYDRSLRWIDLSWQKAMERKIWEYSFFPFTEKTYQLISQTFHIDIPKDYRYTADFFCNYIGFRSRKELSAYVQFYRPFIDFFFNDDYSVKNDPSEYVRTTGNYRNEKSFTFLLELLCHLFFFQNKEKYFGLHYDGYYSIDEFNKQMRCIEPFKLPLTLQANRFFSTLVEKSNYNSLAYLKNRLRKYESLYRVLRAIIRFLD